MKIMRSISIGTRKAYGRTCSNYDIIIKKYTRSNRDDARARKTSGNNDVKVVFVFSFVYPWRAMTGVGASIIDGIISATV